MEIQAGSAAPDFTIGAHNSDQKVTLSGFKGRPVVVAFMPLLLPVDEPIKSVGSVRTTKNSRN